MNPSLTAQPTEELTRARIIEKIRNEFQEDGKRTHEKKQVIEEINAIFDLVIKQVRGSLQRKEKSTATTDMIVSLFVNKVIDELEEKVNLLISSARRKHTPETFIHELFALLLPEETEPFHVTPRVKKPHVIHQQKVIPEGDLKEVEGVPKGSIMGTVRNFLLTYDFSDLQTEEIIKGKIESGTIPYSSGNLKSYEPYDVAKQIFDACNTADIAHILTQPISIVTNGVKYTITLPALLKSFYAKKEIKDQLQENKLKEIIRNEYKGQYALETFFTFIHIPKEKEVQVADISYTDKVVEALTKVRQGKNEVTTKSGPHILTFGAVTIDMSQFINYEDNPEEIQSAQIFSQLQQWFEYELYPLALLTQTLSIPVGEGKFLDNIPYIQQHIEQNVHITNGLKKLCNEVYEVLKQFHNFIAYYAEVTGKSYLLRRFNEAIWNMDVELSDDASYVTFLKQVMPHLAYNAKSTHAYCFFVTFLNKAKAENIAGLLSMTKTLDVYLKTHTPTTSNSNRQTTRITNDDSILITDRSDMKIQHYISNLPDFQKLQEIYNVFRNSKKDEDLTEKKKERISTVHQCCKLVESFMDDGMITSQEKVNAVKVYLQSYLQHGNRIVGRAKGSDGNKGKGRQLNIAKEIRSYLVK